MSDLIHSIKSGIDDAIEGRTLAEKDLDNILVWMDDDTDENGENNE